MRKFQLASIVNEKTHRAWKHRKMAATNIFAPLIILILANFLYNKTPTNLNSVPKAVNNAQWSFVSCGNQKRVPKNFEQFQTCDFPHRLRKLTKNRRLVNFFEEIRFFWQTQFDCLHKYHFYIKSMQDSTKNSKYAKSIYRSV